MRRLLISALALLVVIAVVAIAASPPPALEAPPFVTSSPWQTVKGASHVHSRRSDGTGTVDDIAAAAAQAGLQFVVLTDHGDGTRAPKPPTYRSGVLCIDAVEVSTTSGHLLALGMPQMPYRLAGQPRDVIEDVHRFGGVAIVAHPGSAKPALQWQEWDLPFNGLEWLNADSEWRDESWGALGRALLTYPVRQAETLAALLDRPGSVIEQWDRLLRRRRVVGIAGADAHARIGFGATSEPFDGRVLARLPSYEASFRAFVNHLVLDSPLTGNPAVDAQVVVDSIRYGHVAASIDGLAVLTGFDVTAEGSGHTARVGDFIESASGVVFRARIGAPPGTTLALVRDGAVIYDVEGNELATSVGADPAVYRIEAYLHGARPGVSMPWLMTNPIYVNVRSTHRLLLPRQEIDTLNRMAVPTGDWQAEASDGSESALSQERLEDGTPVLTWRLTVVDGKSDSPFAAVSFPVGANLANSRGVQLRARADRPLRIWAQLRTAGDVGGRRWSRSMYLDETMRTVQIPFDQFRPMAGKAVAPQQPPLQEVTSLLLVADTVHTLPGTTATISFADLWLVQ